MTAFAERVMQWTQQLNQKIKDANKPVLAFCASIDPNGIPKLNTLVFQKFHEDKPIIIFSGSVRQPEVISSIKIKNAVHEILFDFGNESFKVNGKMYIVSSPHVRTIGNQSTRIIDIEKPFEYWERERLNIFKSISNEYRASFTWPVSGKRLEFFGTETSSITTELYTIKQNYGKEYNYEYTSLEYCEPHGDKLTEVEIAHNLALDNFCLFILKPAWAEHIRRNEIVPSRTFYDEKQGWKSVRIAF
jgi:hypothetical protein